MKRLITILLLLTAVSATSQNAWRDQWLKQDKYVHLSVSSFLVPTNYVILKDLGMNDKNAEIVSIAVTLGLGMTKEYLIDAAPSPYDFGANIVGAVAGVYLNRWLQRVENKRYGNIRYIADSKFGSKRY